MDQDVSLIDGDTSLVRKEVSRTAQDVSLIDGDTSLVRKEVSRMDQDIETLCCPE